MLPGNFTPQHHQHQNDANGQVQVLGTDTEAQRQAVAQDADNQGCQHRTQDAALAAGVQGAAQNNCGNDC